MSEIAENAGLVRRRRIPRNLWAVSIASFLMDVSSEMVLNVVPLFLANVLGARTVVIGFIEGVAAAATSLLQVVAGTLSDRWRARKWLAVAGYGLSALAKPGFYFVTSWGSVAGVRWADRVGKGIRTAPRDALVADSIDPVDHGLAFGLHRAADTGGAMLGLLGAMGVVWLTARGAAQLTRDTFQMLVLVSIIPAALSVLTLAVGAVDVPVRSTAAPGPITFRGLGRPFVVFMVVAGLFDLGNFSDAFMVLRAQERGLGLTGVLGMLAAFNLVYAVLSTPAGWLSDRIGRKRVIVVGWVAYAAIYLGFALAQGAGQVVGLYVCYGAYYGLTTGTTKALLADLVSPPLRGTAFGTYNATLGLLDVPASFIAGLLWQGIGTWPGFGPTAPFLFAAAAALTAAILLAVLVPEPSARPGARRTRKRLDEPVSSGGHG
jgi:MFS family permease